MGVDEKQLVNLQTLDARRSGLHNSGTQREFLSQKERKI